MKKLKLYLETSVWNFYYADDAPEKRDITINFFDIIRAGKYEIFISELVIEEIIEANEITRKKLLYLIDQFEPILFDIEENVIELSQRYIDEVILTERRIKDATHAAVASINEIDILVSWNCKHLVNINRKNRFNIVNFQEGYRKPIEIATPEELIDYEI